MSTEPFARGQVAVLELLARIVALDEEAATAELPGWDDRWAAAMTEARSLLVGIPAEEQGAGPGNPERQGPALPAELPRP